MEVNRLKSDELSWELLVRGCDVGNSVEQKRAQLRRALLEKVPIGTDVQLDPYAEFGICKAKLDELIGCIQEFDQSNRVNEYKRISSRLLHLQTRLNRIDSDRPEVQRRKDDLTFLLVTAIEALNDADHIARLMNRTLTEQTTLAGVDVTHHEETGSTLDAPNVTNQQLQPAVAELIDFGLPVATGSPVQMEARSETSTHDPGLREDPNASYQLNRQVCARLMDRVNALTLQPDRQLPDDRPRRRVSFGPDTMESSGRPRIETMSSPLGAASTNFGSFYNAINHGGVNSDTSSRCNDSVFRNPFSSSKNVPIYKWNVYFDGNGSVTSFIEEVEHLAEARNVPKSQLFHSAYEILKGDARDWYLPRKNHFTSWEDFTQGLRDAFLPLNYEETLLEEIKRRTQGSEERLILYVTRMQNLFKKLTSKRPSEQEQVEIIRKRLLPYLQTALTFETVATFDELLSKGKRVEQSRWEAQQYCPPPTRCRYIQEPHLAYRTSLSSQKPVVVRSVQTRETAAMSEPTMSTNSPSTSVEAGPAPVAKPKEIRCWNCDQLGHRRSKCDQPRKLTCFKCGQDGYSTRTCPTCSKNVNQGT